MSRWALAISIVGAVAGAALAAPAELVLRGGHVETLDPARPRASALAVADGRILALGDDPAVMAFAGPKTRVVELRGRTVLCALTDAHAHLYDLGVDLERADLRGCASPAECAERARRFAAERGLGRAEWVLGRGWDQNRFPDRAFPTRAALDHALPDHPAWLTRVDGHAGWANRRALALAGIDRATADPPGGRILRDRHGEPTGILVDQAQALVERKLPTPTRAGIERAILRAQDEAIAHGLTSVHEMGITPAVVAVYRELAQARKLRLRVYAFAAADPSSIDALTERPPEPARPGSWFRLGGIKLYADGALGSRGAALFEPYRDEPGQRGLVITPAELLEHAARRALGSGWQIAVHAIGDRGNRMTLDAFARAGCTRARDHRFRIEHAQVVAPADIPRFAALGVIASMQPVHATSDMAFAEARLGRARLRGAYAWHSLITAGARLIAGSDFPVEDVDPIAGLYAAVTRTDRSGNPPGGWLPEERMTFEQALGAFSRDAAFGGFEEGWRGRAAVGQAADLTVLDRDLRARGLVDALRDARIDATMVAGHFVYERAGAGL